MAARRYIHVGLLPSGDAVGYRFPPTLSYPRAHYQRIGDAPADPSIPHQHDVPGKMPEVDCHGEHRKRVVRACQFVRAAVVVPVQLVDNRSFPEWNADKVSRTSDHMRGYRRR